MLETPTAIDLRLAVTDDPVGDYPEKIKCPDATHKARVKQTDKNKSLAIYAGHVHCYGCLLHLALPDPAHPPLPGHIHPLAFLLGVSNEEALAAAPRYSRETLDAYRDRAAAESRTDPLPSVLAELYHEVLVSQRAHRLEWLYTRGLSDAMIDRALLGHDGNRFVLPIFDADAQLVSLRYRRDEEYSEEITPKYSGMKGRNGFYVYPEHWLAAGKPEAVVLCEGELDALRLYQERIPAITATNGAGQSPRVMSYLADHYPFVKRVFIATDMDEPGREAARVAAEEARKRGLIGEIVEWNPQAKDVTDAIAIGALDPRILRGYLTSGRRSA